MARFRRSVAFDDKQDRALRTSKLKLLSLSLEAVGQQSQLIQCLLQLRGRFRHRRAGRGPATGFAPICDGFFSQPSLFVMLRESLRLSVHQLWRMGFERFRDLGVQLLPSAA
jgi:hypothetical protein